MSTSPLNQRSLRSVLALQWQLIAGDRWFFSLLTWIPIGFCLTLYWVFSQGIATSLPIGIVDFNRSALSQELVRHYDATPMLKVSEDFSDVTKAKQALVNGDIYAFLVIPENFDKQVITAVPPPTATLFYNSQYLLVARLVNSAAVQAQGYFNAAVETQRQLMSHQQTLASAMGNAVTVRTQITPLFNNSSNYAQFLVPALIPAVWQIMAVALTVLALAKNYRHLGLSTWFANQRYFSGLLLVLTPYALWFSALGILYLGGFYYLLNWPMHGELWVIVVAQIATTFACMIMGSLFFFLTCDAARAMSFAAAYTAPSFAFMGITFPASDMNSLALFWRQLLPVSHYIEVQISQASYGLPSQTSLAMLLPMIGYLVPLILCLGFVRRHVNKEVAQ
ncbi:ABC transporter permease [Vibrio hippocampi]|uniref:ABC-2 type transporter transmembrane domain-containing protein n=1 Tax=Vibrio hippocampi TaxID=654686 RepID=A0ABN8DL10_9VIBR|nr:ABC transporter permease [Vibrio hippocampi]CAH0526041.1 hypothetical protein VHP8226_01527 [Vibrio hippocampi]